MSTLEGSIFPIKTKEDYEKETQEFLNLISGWEDPYPVPQIIEHEGFHVVRDDLIDVGSKARFASYFVKNCKYKEIVYGSAPACGYAPISISHLCTLYGKKAIFYMAERKLENLHSYQKRAISLGGEIRWVPDGMMVVCEKRAKDYVAQNPEERVLLPMGVKHPTVTACIIQTCRNLKINPDHVWSVGSSGTLSGGLQRAFPDAEVHVVETGHKMTADEIGRAIWHRSPYTFFKDVKKADEPPFPSAKNYDAKCWSIMKEYYKTDKKPKIVLMWNVGY
jgi:hypothetical protein